MEEEVNGEDFDREEHHHEHHLTVLQAIGLMVLLLILQGLFSLGLSKFQGPIAKETNWVHIAITHASSGWLTAQAGVILAGLSIAAMWMPRKLNPWIIFPLLAASAGLTILASELGNIMNRISPIPKEYVDLINQLFDQNLAGVLLSLGIIAPVFEEIIFRGVVFEGLRERYPLSSAIFISSLLFGLVHLLPWAILNGFLLGLFFAWLKLETGSLLMCVGAHSLYNSLPFLLNRFDFLQLPGFNTAVDPGIHQPYWFDAIGVLLLVGGIAGIRALRPAPPVETIDPIPGGV
jgi:membrane protease YdiL (CAAX protease family)